MNKTLESVSFEDLRKSNGEDQSSFACYLEDVFKELCESKHKGINITRFADLIPNCPVFLADKFFISLLKPGGNEKSHLTFDEFTKPFLALKFGTYEEVARVIFNIFDFDKDGMISPKDVKLLLSYIPLKVENQEKEYAYQMESLNELDQLISDTFKKSSFVGFNDFLQDLDTNSANIFLLLFCYIYNTIPIFSKKLTIYKKKSKKDGSTSSPNSPMVDSPKSTNIKDVKKLYMSPSLFSPVSELRDLKQKTNKDKFHSNSILQGYGKKGTPKDDKSKDEVITTPITNSLRKLGAIPMGKTVGIKTQGMTGDSITTKISASSFLKKQRVEYGEKKASNDLPEVQKTIVESVEERIEDDFEKQMNFGETIEEVKEEDLKETVKFEGELYKLQKGDDGKAVLKPFYLAILEDSIYYYRSSTSSKEDYYKSHFLPGCFIREHQKEQIERTFFYSFSIIFPNNVKRYFHKDYEVIHQWILNLRNAIGYKNFFDFYKMGDTIGEGQFGVIKSGINLATKEKVAIKILKKESIKKKEDWDLLRTEIDVMKHSKHPSIIKFLDHYENSDYIFIVMELLTAGTLQKYLEKKEFKVSERMVAFIAYQIAEALVYLHKYGVIHRDLKPENILLKDNLNFKDGDLEIRLMDFGLSKILGTKEKTSEGYGTMAFVAPEIITRSPYDNSVDVWSLGVIIYYSLTGEIPFMPANYDMDEMATNICSKDLVFSTKFKNRSAEVKDLIKLCLIKKSDKRIKIEEVINHPWFLKELQDK